MNGGAGFVYFDDGIIMSSEMLDSLDLQPLEALQLQAQSELTNAGDDEALKAWHGRYLGDKGEIKLAIKKVGTIAANLRRDYGQAVNRIKDSLTAAYEQALTLAKQRSLQRSLTAQALDVTLPGRPHQRGRLHLATKTLREIYAIFADLGFQIYRSREVESDENNFELLNMPPHHPARDMWDTFHTTTPGVLLRTHTSPGQIHVMRELCPEPIRVILPGMCYRYEAITPRSEIMFHQVEGLAVGEHITMADLKGTVTAFARRLFGEERKIRIRSSYFPFTEPSIEVDVDWPSDDPNADRLTKGTGWLEIMGAGMVHPIVLRNGGYDPNKFSGFAFGMGPQRIAMLKHGIDDIRQFWANDLRFLRQF
jgi:phenylalanyl-tRNA synthetase alpha chain